jgi:hypothetical protein
MSQMIEQSKPQYIGHNGKPLHIDGIIHSDNCGRHWYPATYDAVEVMAIFDHTIHHGIELIPTNTITDQSDMDKPMSMFARAYNGEISDITKALFLKTP